MLSDLPLVSCIMPTFNRRPFVPHAIRYFLCQDYPKKELIVVDDGTDPVVDLMRDNESIRYVRLTDRRTVGAKRNLACVDARGEIIVHCDDDDWNAPWRLRYQVEELLAAKADICGLDRVLFYAPAQERVWEYVYPPGQRRWVYGASLCYTKAFWQTHRFLELRVGEDTSFVWADARAKIHVLPDKRFLVALVHESNISPKRTSDPRYRAKPVEDAKQLLGTDVAFPQALQDSSNTGQSSAGGAKSSNVQIEVLQNDLTSGTSDAAAEQRATRPTSARCLAPSPNGPASDSLRPSALITAAPGVGDILRITPLIRATHQLGYDVDVLLATDYPEVLKLLEGAPEIRRAFDVPSRHCANASSRLDGLANRCYDVATFTPWSAILRRRVQTRRMLELDRAKWLGEGYSQSVEQLARNLGWKGVMPEPFAIASQRVFELAPGTVAIHPGCNLVSPWKRWHGFDELARRFPHVVIVGTDEDLRTDNTYFHRAFEWPVHAQDLTGKLSLADTAALLRECARSDRERFRPDAPRCRAGSADIRYLWHHQSGA